MTRPKPRPRMRFALRSAEKSVRDLWEQTERDPSDLAQKVAKYQLWLARKKAGKLPPYEVIETGMLRRMG